MAVKPPPSTSPRGKKGKPVLPIPSSPIGEDDWLPDPKTGITVENGRAAEALSTPENVPSPSSAAKFRAARDARDRQLGSRVAKAFQPIVDAISPDKGDVTAAENARQRELQNQREIEARARQKQFAEQWPVVAAELDGDKNLARRPTSLFGAVELDGEPRRSRIRDFKSSLEARTREIRAAAHCTNFQLGMIFQAQGYFAALRDSLAQFNYFHADLRISCAYLNEGNRIRTMSALLARIADLQSSGRSVLTEKETDEVASIILNAYTRNVGPVTTADLAVSLSKPKWTPPDRWREVHAKETAAAYFERTIAPLPMAARPTTTEVAELQPEFYRALKTLCSEQKRFDRTGDGEIGRARAVSDVLPIGSPKAPVRNKSDDHRPA